MQFTDNDIRATGAFLVGELERLDQELYTPIADFTWSRDIDLRSDVTMADELTSFILTNYHGGFGGTGVGKKSWITSDTTTPAQIGVSNTKVMNPLTPWGMEVRYSIFELMKSQQVGRSIDTQKHDAMRMKHQLDIDTQVYVGDKELGVTGLLNSDDKVTTANVGAIKADATNATQIIDIFNNVLNTAWKATSYTRVPNRILIPPKVFASLVSTQLPNTSSNLLKFVKENSITVANGGTLEILPCKWLGDETIFTTPRMVAYTKARDVVRFPLVQLQSMAVQFKDYDQVMPYYGALGAVEIVRPEMVFYGELKD